MSVLSPVIDYIDGATRRIYLLEGVSDFYPIEDIYHEYRYRRRTDLLLRKWDPLLRAEGNISKGAGAFTPRYVVLLDGTKMVPFNEQLQVNQLGDMITDDPDVDPTLYDVSGLTVAKPIFIKPSEAETIQLNSESIVYSSFQNAVWFDPASLYGDIGSAAEPNGNRERPVNTINLATQIANTRGFDLVHVMDSTTISLGAELNDFSIQGASAARTEVNIETAALVGNLNIANCKISGVLDGGSHIHECVIANMEYVNGHIHRSALAGKITLGGTEDAYIEGCRQVDMNIYPEVDMGASGQNLVMVDYIGLCLLTNIHSASTKIGVGLAGGRIIIPSVSCSAGFVHVSGQGRLVDEYGTDIETGIWNGLTIINELTSNEATEKLIQSNALSEDSFLALK